MSLLTLLDSVTGNLIHWTLSNCTQKRIAIEIGKCLWRDQLTIKHNDQILFLGTNEFTENCMKAAEESCYINRLRPLPFVTMQKTSSSRRLNTQRFYKSGWILLPKMPPDETRRALEFQIYASLVLARANVGWVSEDVRERIFKKWSCASRKRR